MCWSINRTALFCMDTGLAMCEEPLHRLHLQPTFDLPPLNPKLLERAFHLFMEAYQLWVQKYGLEDQMSQLVTQYFDCCSAAFSEQSTGTKDSNDPKDQGDQQS